MLQAKLIIVAIYLCFFNISFASSSCSDIKDYTLTVNEKPKNSGDKSLKDYGPITICADKVVYDSNENILTYYNNVFVIQINNKNILCDRPLIVKKNVEFSKIDKKYQFKHLQKKWYEEIHKLCSIEKKCNFISGQILVIQLNKDRKVKTLTMESEGIERCQFYTFPTNSTPNFIDIKKITRGPVMGIAKKIRYNVENQTLELEKKAEVMQNDNKYHGEKIIYDIRHNLISIPGNSHIRSTIILDGISKQTKVNI